MLRELFSENLELKLTFGPQLNNIFSDNKFDYFPHISKDYFIFGKQDKHLLENKTKWLIKKRIAV